MLNVIKGPRIVRHSVKQTLMLATTNAGVNLLVRPTPKKVLVHKPDPNDERNYTFQKAA